MSLVRQLEEVRTTHEGDWRDEYYLGLVHMERGDGESALEDLGAGFASSAAGRGDSAGAGGCPQLTGRLAFLGAHLRRTHAMR